MRRRTFIAGLGSTAAWPLVGRAQQSDRVRRVGVLMPWSEDHRLTKITLSPFVEELASLGWSEGRNLRTDVRSSGDDPELVRRYARELVAQQSDVILAEGTLATAAVQRETRTIPIVFVEVSDPVGSGFVAGLPHPGGNITGFSHLEPSMASKWVELLSEVAPGLPLMAAMFNPDRAPYVETYYLPHFKAAARSLNVQSMVAPVRNEAEIEAVMTSLGREPAAGVILMPDIFLSLHLAPIFSLAAHYSLPTITFSDEWVRAGGLLSYGHDPSDLYRRSASYVDRIFRGAKPDDLPVQLPTKFRLVINLNTAKAIGLAISGSFLLRADEVIE
jgi:putative tryptophan/tyrosine transport system substrate-binding protein